MTIAPESGEILLETHSEKKYAPAIREMAVGDELLLGDLHLSFVARLDETSIHLAWHNPDTMPVGRWEGSPLAVGERVELPQGLTVEFAPEARQQSKRVRLVIWAPGKVISRSRRHRR
jgi:hypothetical protein